MLEQIAINTDGSATEVWKDIKDYKYLYKISNYGIVKVIKDGKEKILEQCKDNKGHSCVSLCRRMKRVHVLLYEAFNNCKVEKGMCIHHKDIDVDNNSLSNLELMTMGQHTRLHRIGKPLSLETRYKLSISNKGKHHTEESCNKMSIAKIGENNPTSKLKNNEVWLIKKILNSDYYKSGQISLTTIGHMFNTNACAISHIKSGRLWNSVTYP